MRDQSYQKLVDRAAGQHGVFSIRDVMEFGFPTSTLTRWSDSGRFRPLSRGVYAVAGSPDTTMQRIAAAVLAMPSLAAVSHDTAAEAWGMTRRGFRSIHVVTTRWDRVEREGVKVHESLDLIGSDVVTNRGIPMTTPQRTVVDLGATNRWLVEVALEEGIRRGLMTIEDVAGVVGRVGRRGRRGVGVIRPLLEERRKLAGVTESALEDLFRKTLGDLGLPQPRLQFVVRDHDGEFVCRADFAYPRRRILIELDSEAHHMNRTSFYLDRSKQNRAMTLGWRVLRFTWRDLQYEPYRVGAEIRAVLGSPRS